MQAKMVRTIRAADEVRAIDTIVMAFAADPVARWCWPDSHQYLTSMPVNLSLADFISDVSSDKASSIGSRQVSFDLLSTNL